MGATCSVQTVSRFYATTPIYYVNDEPHIGHAYSTIVGDALTRWHRLLGDDVKFLTGTDEHGQKIQQAAAAAGLAPQEFADGIAPRFAAAWRGLDIANDDFIRTTEPRHYAAVTELLQRCYDAGDIELDYYRGKYCVRCEAYYTDDELLPRRPVPDPQDAGRRVRGGELLLPPVPLRRPAAGVVRRPSRRDRARVPRQRGARHHPLRPARLLGEPHQHRVGRAAPVGPQARRLRVVRRAHQLHQRRRLRHRRGGVRALVAGRRAHHRQGHHPLPLRLLAGDADVGRHRPAPAATPSAAGCSSTTRRCRSPPATWSSRSTWSTRSASTGCATTCSPTPRTATTATSPTTGWSLATTPTSPTTSATSPPASPPWSNASAAASARHRRPTARSPTPPPRRSPARARRGRRSRRAEPSRRRGR